MLLSNLIDMLKDVEAAPIHVDEIRDLIVNSGIIDDVGFVLSDMNQQTVKGFIRKFTYQKVPYGETVRAANIYYSKELNDCWRRLVCAKELVHLLDHKTVAVNSAEKMRTLLVGLTSSTDFMQLDDKCKADVIAEITSIPVLVPAALRNKIRPKYIEGKMSSYDVAYYFRVPQKYVPLIMGEEYELIMDILVH